jgi:hypothetical protein
MNYVLICLGLMIVIGLAFMAEANAVDVVMITKTQNYLSTPYLANPNNRFVDAELKIITISTQSLNTS